MEDAAARVPRPHLIRVHVYEARGLVGKDSSTSMTDGLAVVRVGPCARLRQETETKYNTVNAQWGRTFMFEDVMLSDEDFAREKITVEVFNRNVLFKNEFIGSHEFSVENIYRQKGHEYSRKWVPLTMPGAPGRDQGYVLVSIYVLKDGDPTPSQDRDLDGEEKELMDEPDLGDRKKHLLNVLVYRATHLVPTKSYGDVVNPFVSVRFNGNTIQSQRLYGVGNPLWNRKFEMPFHMPLDSDSIEVQVWDSRRARPDVLIGSVTFSYFQLRLTHRSWGPRWVPLYSSDYIPPDTTFLGKLMDSIGAPGKDGAGPGAVRPADTRSEYVGRVLMRLSVTPISDLVNPRLASLPCNPAIEPPGEEYVAHMVLYSGSEIPVMGGKLRVEMVFGPQRVSSKWVLGKNGVFHWRQVLDTIELYAPKDLDQVQDIIINVYHKAGSTSRKICFERIPARRLLPERGYFINGETRKVQESAAWRPKWRTLRHVMPDPKQSHIVAGFLLCTVGFGLRRARPARPRYLKSNAHTFTLRVRLHQAGNLPAGDWQGSANAFCVVRFAGQSCRFGVKDDTLFPFWYEKRALHVNVDKRHAPSVYVMVYHQGALGQQLLGRAEVLAQDITPDPSGRYGRFAGRLMRVPLFSEEHPRYSAKELHENNSRVPYVLMSVLLDEYDERCREVVPAGEEPDPEVVAFRPWQSGGSADEAFKDYAVKLEAVGLRQILPFSFSSVKNPELLVDYPNPVPGGEREEPREFNQLDPPAGGSVGILDTMFLPRVKLPLANLHGVPLRFRLYDNGTTGRRVVGALSVPVAEFIHGNIERPPFYVPETTLAEEEEAPEAAAPGGGGGGGGDDGAPEGASGRGGGYADDGAPGGTGGGRAGTGGGGDEGDGGAGLGGEGSGEAGGKRPGGALDDRNADEFLVLDAKHANVAVVHEQHRHGKGDRNNNLLRKAERKKEEVGPEVESREENRGEDYVYKELTLRRGEPQTSQHGRPFSDALQGCEAGAVLKAFCRVVPSEMAGPLQQDDLLGPIRPYYLASYVVRLYVFRGVNLTPREKTFGGGRQQTNSYLVASNGRHSDNNFSDRVNYHPDEPNPGYYQVIEMPAQLPDNNALEVAVWDRDEYKSDELIGSTTVDLEWRLLHGLGTGPMEYRVLKRPGSRIAQGKVLMRVDVLHQEAARRTKAEDLRAPAPLEYELRLIVWATRGVRLPEEKDSNELIDQQVEVESNFEGRSGGEMVKRTDIADQVSGGSADFNYRMIWRVQLPCKAPRLKLTMRDDRVRSQFGIGECLYNLQPFFSKALREKQSRTRQREKWVPFTHPDYRGVKLGEVCIELLLLTAVEAEQTPAGEAQSDPNRDPFLPNPHRNLPAYAVGSRGLDWLKRRQACMICLCLFAVTLPILVPFLLAKFKDSAF